MSDYPQSAQQKSKAHDPLPLRPGVFERALIRELTAMGAVVFAILLGIVVLSQLIRLLGDSVGGSLPVEAVLVLMGFAALNYLPVLLSVSLFLAVLLTLTRSYSDSEMVVWFCTGSGLTRWIRPVMWFALPVVSVIALLSLVLSPWAMSKVDDIKHRLDTASDVTVAAPGVFRESKQADRVFFLENLDRDTNRVGNIFVQSVEHGKVGSMVAKQGYQETAPNGDRFLVLLNGRRYEGTPGQKDYRIVEFERYAMRVEVEDTKLKEESPKAYSTLFLLQNQTPWNLSELHWRLGLPISALILSLLAIPLSFVNPRAGRSLNLMAAIVIYMVYNNLISVTNTWVGQSKVSPTMGLLGLHLLMLSVVVVWFYHRMSVYSWKRLLLR